MRENIQLVWIALGSSKYMLLVYCQISVISENARYKCTSADRIGDKAFLVTLMLRSRPNKQLNADYHRVQGHNGTIGHECEAE